MKCTFMHRTIPVAQLELDEAAGFIQKIYEVYAPEHVPVGVVMRKGIPDRRSLNEWWMDRSIPASRSGIRQALDVLGVRNTGMLVVRCCGLSLSDQYWIRPEGTSLVWEKVNFFDNAFSEDIGDVLFGVRKREKALDFSSPDSTSDGNLKKRWKIIHGKRCLIKGGSNPYRQQPFNEVIASEIMSRLGIEHVTYRVIWDQGAPYSICEDFVTADTELVPAWRILQTQKKKNDMSLYQHFVKCAADLGIENVVPFLDRMITLDYIIANEDRHLNNFGAVRDARTLQWLGMAPIYDSGSSLGYDKLAFQIRQGQDIICKPFKKHHEQQLQLVTDFGWFQPQKLSDVGEMVLETLSAGEAAEYMEENRIQVIADTLMQRIEHVTALAQAGRKKPSAQKDSTADDVTENIAESYV